MLFRGVPELSVTEFGIAPPSPRPAERSTTSMPSEVE